MIAGRYTVDREIGRGGSGVVWLGRDEVLGRAVALKRLGFNPGSGSPDLDRAEREARLAARLNHPHVVAVYDLVHDGDEQWLVMEYVAGETLAALVKREGPLAPDQAGPIIEQAADALAAAHGAGIVHRDVKPSNILVTPDGQVKLSDFGIARAQADASLTQTGLVTGSPAYLAPEVASGQTATEASDVWSLGATLFHALAGHPPYDVGDNVLGALYRIVHEEPPQLTNAGWLAPVLQATMTREPQDRWTDRPGARRPGRRTVGSGAGDDPRPGGHRAARLAHPGPDVRGAAGPAAGSGRRPSPTPRPTPAPRGGLMPVRRRGPGPRRRRRDRLAAPHQRRRPESPERRYVAVVEAVLGLVVRAGDDRRGDRRRDGELRRGLPRHRDHRPADRVGRADPDVPGGERQLRAVPEVLERLPDRRHDLVDARPEHQADQLPRRVRPPGRLARPATT